MIEDIAAAGGHAAKFQTYKAELLATADTSPAYWDRSKEQTASQFALFKRWDNFGPAEYEALARHCEACGIDFLSTPFDLSAVGLIARLAPAIKIASADITNIPLLREAGSTSKPVILSVGAARTDEIALAIGTLEAAGGGPITLLHCVLNYPTKPQDAQLAQIVELQRLFGHQCTIGYSDHVAPADYGDMPALELAVMGGAVVIEKHFTDDRSAQGNDHYHAMDASGLARFMKRLAHMRMLWGNGGFDLSGQTAAIENARRRVVSLRSLAAGEAVEAEDLVALRSNQGIEIGHWDRILGRKLRRDVPAGRPLEWEDIA
jgi:N-acetylneuraminate synthase